MENFEKKNFIQQRRMALEELKLYQRELRKYEYYKDKPIKGIVIRKKMYYLIQFILKIDRLLSKRTLTIIGNEQQKNKRPKIYACTHIGRYDIESAIEAVGESSWFVMGDPGESYRNMDGILLRLNGVSWFDMGSTEELKFDAHTVNHRQTKILNQGGNELSFPEAAWNLDPIRPVGDIHPGIIKRAIRTGAEIIPVAIEQYRGTKTLNYYVNIGKNMDLTGANISEARAISLVLQENLAGLKWQIWERYGQISRNDLPKTWEEGYEAFLDSIMRDTENGYTIEEINRTKYTDPNKKLYENPEETFSYLENIQIKLETAFMARDIIDSQRKQVLKKTL